MTRSVRVAKRKREERSQKKIPQAMIPIGLTVSGLREIPKAKAPLRQSVKTVQLISPRKKAWPRIR
ncbi:MAG: hypothetical protein BWY86_00759 [Candidatus Aminicenantes bacterium ADurb.Bin508]|nr:MAG: hypothetical protein BWY86_00759 [Candidatus Aminicenantes bacterium ADurb.Bin508]